MKLIKWGFAAALALAVATPALATDFSFAIGPGTDSTDFGRTAKGSGSFDDRFIFTVPAGSANGLVGSIALSSQLDVDIAHAYLDTTPFDLILTDGTELQTLAPTTIAAGTHFIRVVGTWGEDGGSYAGTINYTPAAAVPEPAGWLMMIAGFGGIGAALRRRRRDAFGFA